MFTPDGENIVGIPKLHHFNGLDDTIHTTSTSKVSEQDR